MLTSALRAFSDLFRPKILALVLIVPVLALFIWVIGGFLLVPLLRAPLQDLLVYLQVSQEIGSFIFTVILILLLFPLVYWTSLILLSFLALPFILKILKPQYPRALNTPEKVGLIAGGGLMLRVFSVAVPLYLLLLLTIWLPWVYAVGAFVLGAWVNVQFLSLEILSELVDKKTTTALMKQHRKTLWIMGFGLMFLLSVPLLQLITPVFGGLWFTHWWLQQLSNSGSSRFGAQT